MLTATAAVSINHLLRGESWAPERLRHFTGKTAAFHIAPFKVAFTVRDNGEVAPAARDCVADVTLVLNPLLLARVLAHDEAAAAQVEASGDSEFAAAIRYVAAHLRWDFEEDLSRLFGDVAAHRMANTARSLARWQAQNLDALSHAAAEYWTEERPLIAKRAHVEQFARDVDQLRGDLERLEKRLEKLSRSAQD